jgi:hypothetical protein
LVLFYNVNKITSSIGFNSISLRSPSKLFAIASAGHGDSHISSIESSSEVELSLLSFPGDSIVKQFSALQRCISMK